MRTRKLRTLLSWPTEMVATAESEVEMSLKDDLNIENDKPIPADYQIPYFVHQDDMNKLDMSHKRVEKWLLALCIAMFIALVGTNAYWIYYENSFQDVVVTENSQDGEGINIMSGGDVSYGAEVKNSEDQGKEKWND